MGLINFDNGDTYNGDLLGGVKHGEGTYTWASGNTYTGAFVDGVSAGGSTAGQGTAESVTSAASQPFVTSNTEFQINTYTTGDQSSPSVTSLRDGGFVVTWRSGDQDGDTGGVYGQRYDSAGATAGNEFQVNTYTTSNQTTPSVSSLSDTGFVVTWMSEGQDGDSYGIYGQRFDASGEKVRHFNNEPILTTSSTISTDEDTASSAIVFSATDVDGDSLTYSFSDPSKGSVTNNGNGTYTYTPAANENGADSFTVTVNDGTVDVSQTVDVTINAVNDPPVFISSTESLSLENATLSSVIYNAKAEDGDGDQLTFSLVNSLNIEVAGEGANGEINIALFDDIAPLHTDRLATLAVEGAYDDVVFHRVIDGFMAQTGDVQYGKLGASLNNAGQGGSDNPDILAEFSTVPFDRGIVGMARSSDSNSANSQFFMMFEQAYHLNENYTVVGEITSGLDVLDAIKRGEASLNGIVTETPDYMKEVTFTPATDLFNIGDQSGPSLPGHSSNGEVTFKNLPDFSTLGFGEFVVSVSDGTETIYQTVELTLPPQNIGISFSGANEAKAQLPDQSLVFVSSETDTTTVAMSSGGLDTLSQNLSFTHVELSNSSYDHGIAISDVVLQLRDIVGLSSLEGKQKIAADIDRDGTVAISDVVSNLRHIVGLDDIEQCALVNSSDALVTSLTTSTVADLTLVQYGDVDLSATFVENIETTGSVTVTGTAMQGSTLTLTHTLTDPDGLASVAFQWMADDVAISGATGDSYRLTSSEVAKTIYVNVTATDQDGFQTIFTSNEVLGEPIITILVLDDFSYSTAILDNVELFDYKAEYTWGWAEYALDSLDQLGEVSFPDNFDMTDLVGFSARDIIEDTNEGTLNWEQPDASFLAYVDPTNSISSSTPEHDNWIYGDLDDAIDDDPEQDYIFDVPGTNANGGKDYYFLNDIDGIDSIPWLPEGRSNGIYISNYDTFTDLDGTTDYFASMIDFIPQNGDSDPDTDYVLFDWQNNMSVDPETEGFYFIGSTSDEIDTWATLTNSHNTTEHGDVVVSELLNQIDPSDLENVRIIAIDILDDDRTDILGQSIQSTDTDYLLSTKGFEDMKSAVFDELDLSLSDIDFANMSFSGGSRGDLILEFANQGILTFASLPNDGLHAARYWDPYLKETVQDSATVAIDVAGSDSEGAGFPDSLQFADLLRSNSAETYPDLFGTSFATPEALGDVVANLLDADNETYLSLFADGAIMVSEVQTLVPVLDIV